MSKMNFLNDPVAVHCRRNKNETGYKFGLELELEGANVNMEGVATPKWTRTTDASLRGESVEYIFTAPLELTPAKEAVTNLFAKFEKNKVRLNKSYRTSTHVHLNFSDKTVRQMFNFYFLYTALEEMFDHYAGENRSGNLFCLSYRLSSGIMKVVSDAIATNDLSAFMEDRFKYAACNLCTLHKFNSIEVRVMRGASNAQQVNDWLDILNDIYHYACDKMVSPVELAVRLSTQGADNFLREIFSEENSRKLLLTFPPEKDIHFSLMEGIRLFQQVAYEHDEAFQNVKIVERKEIKAAKFGTGDTRFHIGPGRRWSFLFNGQLRHGTRCSDNPSIYWNAEEDRMFNIETGERYNWERHPIYGNEGNPYNEI